MYGEDIYEKPDDFRSETHECVVDEDNMDLSSEGIQLTIYASLATLCLSLCIILYLIKKASPQPWT